MKQYGFFFDSTKCTGCKTCQVSCKDEKDLKLGPKFRRIYEYGGGVGNNKMVSGSRIFITIIYQLLVIIVIHQLVWLVVQQVRCISGQKMG